MKNGIFMCVYGVALAALTGTTIIDKPIQTLAMLALAAIALGLNDPFWKRNK